MLKVKQFCFNPFGVNTYLIWDTETHEAMVVDPGMVSAGENVLFDSYVAENGIVVKYIVNTHMHLDHVFGNNYVSGKYGVGIWAHAGDAALGKSVDGQARMFGISLEGSHNTSATVFFKDGDCLSLGEYIFEVIETPGHSPGGVIIYCPKGGFALVGDTIFKGAIGRTDLPGGDFNTLVRSIKSRIFTLPLDTRLLTGHDGSTTVGDEMAGNPYVPR